jgi:hypothetical protein
MVNLLHFSDRIRISCTYFHGDISLYERMKSLGVLIINLFSYHITS